MFDPVSVGRLIPSGDELHRSVICKFHYDIAVVSRGAVVRVESAQQGAQHAVLWGAGAEAEGRSALWVQPVRKLLILMQVGYGMLRSSSLLASL